MRRSVPGVYLSVLASITACSSSDDAVPLPPGIGPTDPPAAACPEAGGSRTVSEPTLVASLGDEWHESWSASPVVADLDADGTREILAARHGLVLGWHLDGSIVFRAEVDGRCWASPVVADLREDLPGLEVAQASSDSIYAWDATGTPLPGFPFAWRGELRSLAAGDVDGDGGIDLVSVTTQNLSANGQSDILIAVSSRGDVLSGFPPNTTGASGCDDHCFTYNGYDQNVGLGDVDDDGVMDVFATQDNAYLSLHRGDGTAFEAAAIFDDRAFFNGIRGLHDYALAQQGWADDEETALQAHYTNSAPAIADVDGDGTNELAILASVQNAAQSRREQGVALWVLENDGTRPSAWLEPLHVPGYLSGLWDYGDNIVAITNQVTVADLFPDLPGPEMLFAGFDGRVHAVSSDRTELWDFTYTSSRSAGTGGILVADLSGDGAPEVVFATYSTQHGVSNLVVLDGGGNLQHSIALPDRGSLAVPTIDDVDGDGEVEIVVSLKDSSDESAQVLVFRVAGARGQCHPWPTGRGTYLRNGFVP